MRGRKGRAAKGERKNQSVNETVAANEKEKGKRERREWKEKRRQEGTGDGRVLTLAPMRTRGSKEKAR